jgi:XTP/dITP diphosphohydrolase
MPTQRTLVIGTGNLHKVQEIAPLLLETGLTLDLRPASEFGKFDPAETGLTLEENARIKAHAAMELSNQWSLSDDTGLFIDALDGRPGIYAARYAGEGCSFEDNIQKVLKELHGVPISKRGAVFRSVIALCRPHEPPLYFKGECLGFISIERRGSGGFGYDPIFTISGLNKSFAELSLIEKNTVSHRSIAVKKCRATLEKLL